MAGVRCSQSQMAELNALLKTKPAQMLLKCQASVRDAVGHLHYFCFLNNMTLLRINLCHHLMALVISAQWSKRKNGSTLYGETDRMWRYFLTQSATLLGVQYRSIKNSLKTVSLFTRLRSVHWSSFKFILKLFNCGLHITPHRPKCYRFFHM